jgi:hypothetical protein
VTRDEAMSRAIQVTIDGAKSVPAAVRDEYLTGVATTAISLMHGTLGREFTAGYLAEAVRSLDDPTTVRLVEPERH